MCYVVYLITLILMVALSPFAVVTVMVVLPFFRAFSLPSLSTVATFSLELSHFSVVTASLGVSFTSFCRFLLLPFFIIGYLGNESLPISNVQKTLAYRNSNSMCFPTDLPVIRNIWDHPRSHRFSGFPAR